MQLEDLGNTYAAKQAIALVEVTLYDLQALMVAVIQASACASSPPSRGECGRSDRSEVEVEVTEGERNYHRRIRLLLVSIYPALDL